MICGIVTRDLEAWIDLAIASHEFPPVGFSAVIDTWFSDYLTLPKSVLEKFGALPRSHARVVLADGSEIISELFELTVLWDGAPITIEVHSAEIEPLVGMALLAGHDLQMRVVPNGEVVIRSVPADV